jgi:hypothetical protein
MELDNIPVQDMVEETSILNQLGLALWVTHILAIILSLSIHNNMDLILFREMEMQQVPFMLLRKVSIIMNTYKNIEIILITLLLLGLMIKRGIETMSNLGMLYRSTGRLQESLKILEE